MNSDNIMSVCYDSSDDDSYDILDDDDESYEDDDESYEDYYEKMSKYTLEQFLDELKEPEIEYNTECPICFNEINQDDKCLTKCGHVYCLACVTSYLENMCSCQQSCPICKENM